MRKIKEVLRLKYNCNLSEREISRSCQVSRSTVADYLILDFPYQAGGIDRFLW
jgi:DNA-binding transcriptional regulator LsrR (DeoR family)